MTTHEIEDKIFCEPFDGYRNRWHFLIDSLAAPLKKAFGQELSAREAFIVAQKMADKAIEEVINIVTDKE